VQREAILEAWIPHAGPWSLWARPVLFAQMGEGEAPALRETWLSLDVSWAPAASDRVVLVVDLPGDEAVWTGLSLVPRGYRPVPMYNACWGPNEVIDQGPIVWALRAGAPFLARQTLRAEAPPAFLLDASRARPKGPVAPGDFDNRWQVYPQDFPSPELLLQREFSRVLVVHRGGLRPLADLADVLRPWQEGGLAIEVHNPLWTGPPVPITLAPPSWYRQVWNSFLEWLGLRRGPRKGFGHVVPSRSHG
jgi:hypothetical protein